MPAPCGDCSLMGAAASQFDATRPVLVDSGEEAEFQKPPVPFPARWAVVALVALVSVIMLVAGTAMPIAQGHVSGKTEAVVRAVACIPEYACAVGHEKVTRSLGPSTVCGRSLDVGWQSHFGGIDGCQDACNADVECQGAQFVKGAEPNLDHCNVFNEPICFTSPWVSPPVTASMPAPTMWVECLQKKCEEVACRPGTAWCCPYCRMEPLTFRTNEALTPDGKWDGSKIRIGGGTLPAALQGIFWLTGQGPYSTLASFARSDDGCDLSTGTLEPDGKLNVRIAGDRVWGFRSLLDPIPSAIVKELTYTFELVEGTKFAPTKFLLTGNLKDASGEIIQKPTPADDWTMTLLSQAQTASKGFPGSTIWFRKNSDLPVPPFPSQDYTLIQIVNGAGQPIQPAFSKWKASVDQAIPGQPAVEPGVVHYFAASGSC